MINDKRFKQICERCGEEIEIGEEYVKMMDDGLYHVECAIDYIECNTKEMKPE